MQALRQNQMPEGRLKIPSGDILYDFLNVKIGSDRDKETARACSSILSLLLSLSTVPFHFPHVWRVKQLGEIWIRARCIIHNNKKYAC